MASTGGSPKGAIVAARGGRLTANCRSTLGGYLRLVERTLRKTPEQIARARRLLSALRRRYPHSNCALTFTAPHELLIATILSAQATDVAVNRATPALFEAYPTIERFAQSTPEAIWPFVKTINFWRMKSRAIHESMRSVLCDHGGEVPRTMEGLVALRGVQRKTANVVLGNAFGINLGVVVDTHVGRLSRRMGLSRHSDPVKIERDLMALFPRGSWCALSHLLIDHGRAVCKARGHLCAEDSICKKFCCEARRGSSLRGRSRG
ncbi:MAG: endonuclease III [Phycisphaerales bacterium]|nr:endonuclease III [Phycisphaerales bacterium]